METWNELDDDDEEADNNEEEANLALMASTFSYTESKVNLNLDSNDANEVFSKLSRSDLITFCQDLMDKCQEKARHMKILKNQYDLLKDELKASQNKYESL